MENEADLQEQYEAGIEEYFKKANDIEFCPTHRLRADLQRIAKSNRDIDEKLNTIRQTVKTVIK